MYPSGRDRLRPASFCGASNRLIPGRSATAFFRRVLASPGRPPPARGTSAATPPVLLATRAAPSRQTVRRAMPATIAPAWAQRTVVGPCTEDDDCYFAGICGLAGSGNRCTGATRCSSARRRLRSPTDCDASDGSCNYADAGTACGSVPASCTSGLQQDPSPATERAPAPVPGTLVCTPFHLRRHGLPQLVHRQHQLRKRRLLRHHPFELLPRSAQRGNRHRGRHRGKRRGGLLLPRRPSTVPDHHPGHEGHRQCPGQGRDHQRRGEEGQHLEPRWRGLSHRPRVGSETLSAPGVSLLSTPTRTAEKSLDIKARFRAVTRSDTRAWSETAISPVTVGVDEFREQSNDKVLHPG